MTNGHADKTDWNATVTVTKRAQCRREWTVEQRKRQDAIALSGGLFTVFLCLFIVLLG